MTIDWSLSDDGILCITGEGPIADYHVDYADKVDTPWRNTGVKRVIISEGITRIGENAFFGCYFMTSVVIPSTVVSIGRRAFHRCTSLRNISVDASNEHYRSKNGSLYDRRVRTLIRYASGRMAREYHVPGSVTRIDDDAFSRSMHIWRVHMGPGIRSIGSDAFSHCQSLVMADIPVNVSSIGEGAFRDCRSLPSVRIPDGVRRIKRSTFS